MRRVFSAACLAVLVVSLLSVSAGCYARRARVPRPDLSAIHKIAVIPFSNISGRRDAGRIVSNIFITELFKTGLFDVEEPGNVMQFLIQERIDSLGEMELDRVRILGKRLNVDAVIVGQVEEFEDASKSSSVPVVSLSARMIDSATGRIVWSHHVKRRGDDFIIIFDFGKIRTVTGLAGTVVREMIETLI
ncbi:MAG TPA: hypothetical protein ENJ37_06115 [Deltaproteobacteria bacterium]|nr:hypothetical protein [Deltaproteobacteria bacterium]